MIWVEKIALCNILGWFRLITIYTMITTSNAMSMNGPNERYDTIHIAYVYIYIYKAYVLNGVNGVNRTVLCVCKNAAYDFDIEFIAFYYKT